LRCWYSLCTNANGLRKQTNDCFSEGLKEKVPHRVKGIAEGMLHLVGDNSGQPKSIKLTAMRNIPKIKQIFARSDKPKSNTDTEGASRTIKDIHHIWLSPLQFIYNNFSRALFKSICEDFQVIGPDRISKTGTYLISSFVYDNKIHPLGSGIVYNFCISLAF
jgi:hypothetical protein